MRYVTSLVAAATATLLSAPAGAVPAFARATGMGCPACHESWPQLNDVGELFRDRGYRVTGTAAEPVDRPLEYVPVSLRAFVGYGATRMTGVDTADGKKTVTSGSFLDPGADVIFGTNVSRHFSVLTVISGFASDGAAAIESAWARVNDIADTSWLNLRVGRHELDLPMSQHRAYELAGDPPFAMFNYHPAGSTLGYAMGDNPLGIELSGHGDGSGLRYSVSLASAAPGAGGLLGGPALYGHLTFTERLGPDDQRLRVGVFGDYGKSPTRFDSTAAGEVVPGTGREDAAFYHVGADLHVTFGSTAQPLLVHAVYQRGEEAKELVGGARAARWHAGLVEIDWIPLLATTVFGRAEAVRNLRQGDPTAPRSTGEVTAFSLGVRQSLWLSAWGSLALHAEVAVVGTDTGDDVQQSRTAIAGIDFAI